jgi:aerobic-type carbon monoxide dehydrogenase small subunit (CoxS/CutS family)
MKVMELQVNKIKHRIETNAERSLLSVLRDELNLTGAKYGCGEGQCGACTVLVDGTVTRSCITKISAVAGKQITTIEGLEQNGRLHPLQEAFIENGAMQCGYCIPGMIMAGVGLLQKNQAVNETEIIRVLQSNICRCGTYPRIVAAVRQVSSNGKSQKGGAR